MNILNLSLTVLLTVLFVNCGGGGDSSSATTTSSLTKIETVEEAKSNFKALTALGDLSNTNQGTTKVGKTLSLKTTEGKCDSGTITLTEEGSISTIVANACTIGSDYIDGTFSETKLTGGVVKFSMRNLTIKNTATELKTSSFVVVENESEYWSTIDGDMNIVSKCFSGNYDFKTITKIYDAQDGSDNAESGVLELNGVRYTFSNPYVTIKTATEEKTILQSELEKKMDSSDACTE